MPKRQLESEQNAQMDQLPLKMVKLVNVDVPPRKERCELKNGFTFSFVDTVTLSRGGYGRHAEAGAQEVVEIYKEDVAGMKVFRCPFCDIKPLGSDIRFRKHLKTHHPQQKTLLRDSVKPESIKSVENQETLPLEIFFPKPLLEKVESMVRLGVGKVAEEEPKEDLVIMDEGEVF